MINDILTSVGVDPKLALTFGPIYERRFKEAGIVAPIEIAHYLAQVLHESGMLKYMREIWGNTAAQARYERDPKKPWDARQKAYGLGNFKLGDGRRYLGRGDIQRTGRRNYEILTNRTGIDFLNNPALLEQPEYAVLSGVDFWKSNSLSRIALNDDRATTSKFEKNRETGKVVEKKYNTALYYLTKRVNGGYNGLDHRQELFDKIIQVMEQRGYFEEEQLFG